MIQVMLAELSAVTAPTPTPPKVILFQLGDDYGDYCS